MSKIAPISMDGLFKVLANEIRKDILETLMEGPKCVMDITEEIGRDQTTISHNLRRLYVSGFVYVKKDGKKRIYELSEDVGPLFELMERHMKLCKKIMKDMDRW